MSITIRFQLKGQRNITTVTRFRSIHNMLEVYKLQRSDFQAIEMNGSMVNLDSNEE